MKNLKKLLLPGTFLLLIVLLQSCGSNKKQITLYPIYDTDIRRVQKGDISNVTGWLISDFYMDNVMQLKIKEHQ